MAEQENTNLSENDTISFRVQEDLPENVKRNFLSEPMIPTDRSDSARKISSDLNIYDNVNYDDLCGPWYYPENPAYQNYDIPLTPRVCTWVFLNETDMRYIQNYQDDKEAILLLIGKKLPNSISFVGVKKDIFLQLMWEVFRFTRDNSFTVKSISSILGIFYFTHRYFLTTLWRTQAETFEFFKESVLLHSVMHPPKSIEVFTLTESKQSLDLFCTMYMRQLPLVRFVCLPNYRLILPLKGKNQCDDHEEKEVKEEKA